MKTAALVLSAVLAWLPTAAPAADLGVELLGFGEQGPSSTFASGREATVRYRVSGTGGAPVDLVLLRDDGATTWVPGVPRDSAVRTVRVPVKPGRFSRSEYSIHAFDPDRGTMVEGPGRAALVQLGPGVAAALTRGPVAARQGPATEPDGFDAELEAGADLDGAERTLE